MITNFFAQQGILQQSHHLGTDNHQVMNVCRALRDEASVSKHSGPVIL